ncbi:MAG: hypothetical protein ACKVU4_03190 [Phycisphaerales bacterium]
MKAVNWGSIRDVEGWRSTLADLLTQARDASDEGDDEELLTIAGALNTFVDRSFPNTPEIAALDDTALQAVVAMTEQIAADAVGRIAARTVKLTALAKQVDQIAAEAQNDAAALRLEKAHAVVDSVIASARAIEELQQVVAAADEEELKERIKSVLADLKKFGELVNKKARLPI